MHTAPSSEASLQQWLDYLLAIHPSEIDMGLARVSEVARRMSLLTLGAAKVITVGGTNGKGTTCVMLESMLAQAGKRVGVYSSPHLLRYNERVRICGQDASDAALIAAFCEIEAARGSISLTFFEFATLAALQLFKAAQLDVVILEVGLGGRLDATNIIDADVAVVTAIDLDHQDYLGNTRDAVGYEKAGIFKAGRPAVVGEPNLPQTVVQVAKEKGAQLLAVGQAFNYQRTGELWQFHGRFIQVDNLPVPNLPLPNAATALAALECLYPAFDQDCIRNGLSLARLTGRFERVSEHPAIYLDVAHNPHAARYLASQMAAFAGRRVLALCGMLKDKDIEGVIQVMSPVVDHWYITGLDTERGADADRLSAAMPAGADVHSFAHIDTAWRALSAVMQPDDVVIVFGSFYTVSGVKSLMNGE